MKRICIIAALIIWSTLSCQTNQGKEVGKESPNIIFILTDDQRDNSFAAMGHPWIKTPHVDALLKKGIRFENSYIAEPTCTPSRASLLLGNHERVNRNGFSSKHRTTKAQWEDSYPALLRKGGYATGYVGKWHVGLEAGIQQEELFDYWGGINGHGPFYFPVKKNDGTEVTITTNRYHTNNALEFMRAQKKGDKPFCLSIAYATPHGSKVRSMHTKLDESASLNERLKDHPIYGGKYRDLDIAYPLQNPDNPYDHIPQDVMNQELGRAKTYNFDYEPVANKEHLYRYYQMVTEIDQMIGELVAELETLGLSENTVLVFASDHGVLLGEYGMGGKALLYDLTSKFPCFVYDPNTPKKYRGTNRKDIVSSLDITATIMDYTGIGKAPFMTGRSLRPLIRGKQPQNPWREGMFLENMYTGRDTPLQEGYVDQEWKYIRYYKKAHPFEQDDVAKHSGKPVFEMLFSLKADPEEKNNLVGNPIYKEKLEELRAKCDSDLETLLKTRKEYATYYGIKG